MLTFGAPLLLLTQALTSCGDDDGGSTCEPNTPLACVLAGQSCEAVQTCLPDGSGYSACACPGGGAGGSGAGAGGSANAGAAGDNGAGAGGGAGEPLFADAVRAVGTPCTTDADCPAGPNGETPLTCIPATNTEVFVGGGPQGGYCTAPCEANADCSSLDRLSGCGFLASPDQGYCLTACTAGTDTRLKCPGGRAQACVPLSAEDSTVGACLPSCTSDAGCGDGLFCDFGAATGLVGLCTATEPPGGDIGAPCAVETQAADCKSGVCIPLGNPDPDAPIAGSYCSATCTYAVLNGCGVDGPSGTARDAVCLLPAAADGTPGDIGFCVELCDQDGDCVQAGWQCVPFDPDLQTQTGRAGECFPPGLDGLTDGADAGVGGDAGG